jgi:hypothetical protein
MPASFGGIQIFGRSVSMVTTDNPTAEQLNHFFGLSGVERIDGGFTGRLTLARGVLSGSTSVNLGIAREAFRAYNDGFARVLVDTLGYAWPNVILKSFEQESPKLIRSGDGCYLAYRATFYHLN